MQESTSTTGPLKLTTSQLAQLSADTDGGTANALLGYEDMLSFLNTAIADGTNTLDSQSTFWYEQAITINGNDPTSFGNIFIHAATDYGLAWDDKSVVFQNLSDKIGLAVISGTLQTGSLQTINSMLEDDIGTSLQYGGMTVGGWGGSFYYWDTPYQGTETVGEAIMADPAQYDKFVATTANAIVVAGNSAIEQLGLTFSTGSVTNEVNEFLNILNVGVPTIVDSAVQTDVKAEVIARAFEEDVLGQSAAGDPNYINGYLYLGNNWFGDSQWIATGAASSSAIKVTDNAELDALRATRISEQDTKSGDAATNIYSAIGIAATAAATGQLTLPSELQKAPGATISASQTTSSVSLNLPTVPQSLVNATLQDILADISHGLTSDFLSPLVNVVSTGLTDVINVAGGVLNTLTAGISSTTSVATTSHHAGSGNHNLLESIFK